MWSSKRDVALHQGQAEHAMRAAGTDSSGLIIRNAVAGIIDDDHAGRRTDDIPSAFQRQSLEVDRGRPGRQRYAAEQVESDSEGTKAHCEHAPECASPLVDRNVVAPAHLHSPPGYLIKNKSGLIKSLLIQVNSSNNILNRHQQ